MDRDSIVKKAKKLLSNIEIVEIDLRKKLKFDKRNTNKNKNDEKYLKWLVGFLQKYDTLDSTIISVNSEINSYLNKYLSSITWSSYSPRDDNSLELNEVMIDLNSLRGK